ncbi:MAG: hypothetical protein MUP98_15600 [Candidatus Aminicenantes bacterium]|nr:hypothetical protein [Candidatus Aminicenantes bacterium]
MKTIPDHLKPFFWEADFSQINIDNNKPYIIERILELGDQSAVLWLFSNYPTYEIKEALEKSRKISAKSRNFWQLILEG